MNRRKFLGAFIAVAAAPALVKIPPARPESATGTVMTMIDSSTHKDLLVRSVRPRLVPAGHPDGMMTEFTRAMGEAMRESKDKEIAKLWRF